MSHVEPKFLIGKIVMPSRTSEEGYRAPLLIQRWIAGAGVFQVRLPTMEEMLGPKRPWWRRVKVRGR